MLFDLICRANEKPTLTLIPCQKKRKTTHILLIIVRNWNIAKLATRIYHPIHDKVKFRKIGKFKKANDVTGAFFSPPTCPRLYSFIFLFPRINFKPVFLSSCSSLLRHKWSGYLVLLNWLAFVSRSPAWIAINTPVARSVM